MAQHQTKGEASASPNLRRAASQPLEREAVMATRAHRAPAEPAIPLPPVLAFAIGAPAAPRSAVEAMIERLVEALDTLDGDPDVELNGDEADGSPAEDEFMDHDRSGPGCPVSDPDYGAEELGEREEGT